MKQIKTQACVIGAGAGGTGCVYRLIKNGVKTVVVDKNSDFGGTAVFGGVDGWEPGVTLDGLHRELYEKMCEIGGCHVVKQVPNCNLVESELCLDWSRHDFGRCPWALAFKSEYSYDDTFRRVPYLDAKRLQFDPSAMIWATNQIFEPYRDALTTLFGYKYVSCRTEGEKVVSVVVSNGDDEVEIIADYFVDASGDIFLARDAGCEVTFGCEGREKYGEPSAGEKNENVNGATYVFRVGRCDDSEHIDAVPEDVSSVDLHAVGLGDVCGRVSYVVEYPNGDFNFNMLPTMSGKLYYELGDRADEVGRAAVWAYWRHLQTYKGMKGFTLKHIYDVGIREGYRLIGKYVLREQDLRRGELNFESKKIVAIADHALDVHGESGMCKELERPYKIPVECAMAKEFDNLFVACRGASFSHIAASSARLTRTMISMGEGVGEYIFSLTK